jgi:hypothetical protein
VEAELRVAEMRA